MCIARDKRLGTAETKWDNSFTEYAAFTLNVNKWNESLVIHRNIKEER